MINGSFVIPQAQVRGLVAELADLQTQIDGISVGATEWGAIGGTLALQIDLQSALDGKLATGLAVLQSGSYSSPSWLTSISGSIVSGNIAGNAAGLSATLAIASGGTGQTTANAALNAILPAQATHSGKALVTDGTNTAWTALGGSGTVTSVGLTAPAQFSVGSSPVTASGTIALSWANQAINVVLAGPASGGAGAPTFRSLVDADIPTISASKVSGNISGNAAGLTATLAATSGGTSFSTYALGDTIFSSAANTLSKLSGNTTTTKKFLRQTGNGTVSAAPAWDTVVKGDVGLSAVENTALSTWGGSANLTTIGTVSKIDVVQYSQVMEITPIAITANEGLSIIHASGGSSSAALIVKANGGETEIQTWTDASNGVLASVNSIGTFGGAGFVAAGFASIDTITAMCGDTAKAALRLVNKASQTASPLQLYAADNTSLLFDVDEVGVASPQAVKLADYAGTASAGMLRYHSGALQLYTSAWADVGGGGGSTNVMPRPNTRRTTMLAADGSGSATFNGYGDAITETYSGRGSAAPSATGPASKYQTSAATTNSNAGIAGQVAVYRTGRNVRYQTSCGVDQTTNERVWVGLTDQAMTTQAASDNPAGDCAAFRYSSGAESTWKCITKDGTTQNITDSSVSADTSVHKFEIVFDDAAPNVKFYIDGTLVATHTANLPSASKNMRFVNNVQTLANEAKTIRTGWVYVESDL